MEGVVEEDVEYTGCGEGLVEYFLEVGDKVVEV